MITLIRNTDNVVFHHSNQLITGISKTGIQTIFYNQFSFFPSFCLCERSKISELNRLIRNSSIVPRKFFSFICVNPCSSVAKINYLFSFRLCMLFERKNISPVFSLPQRTSCAIYISARLPLRFVNLQSFSKLTAVSYHTEDI